jgi:hypothetical protein
MTIRTQQVGQDKGVAVVVAGVTGSVPPPTAADDTGSNDVDTVVTRPKKVNQQVVGGLQGDQAVGGGQLEFVDLLFQLGEPFGRMGKLETNNGRPRLIHYAHIVVALTPINSYQYVHQKPPVSESSSVDPGYCVPTMVLEARQAFDSVPGHAWGTVRVWRSKRQVIPVLCSKRFPTRSDGKQMVLSTQVYHTGQVVISIVIRHNLSVAEPYQFRSSDLDYSANLRYSQGHEQKIETQKP